MIVSRQRLKKDEGFTFVEATLTIVIMSIMVLGLTIVLMAFREHLDRSWAIRAMDQYGNDVIEKLTHELRNAVEVTTRPGIGNTHEIDVTHLDPYNFANTFTTRWRADLRTTQIKVNYVPVDLKFPPSQPGRGEYYSITEFTLNQYGDNTPDSWERNDKWRRNDKFNNATYDIRLRLRYNRNAVNPGERNWAVEKEYYNRVYMRNMNLIIKQGISQ